MNKRGEREVIVKEMEWNRSVMKGRDRKEVEVKEEEEKQIKFLLVDFNTINI